MSNKLNTALLTGILLLQAVTVGLLVRTRSTDKPIVIDEDFMKAFTESFVMSLNKIQSVPVETPPSQTGRTEETVRTIEIQADRLIIEGKTMSASEFEKQASAFVDPATKVLLQKNEDANYKTSVEVLEILRKNGVVGISVETVYRSETK